jgi:predicted GIY-YIG superfamily endonuclease
MFYVYILYSLKDKNLYTGKTRDIVERLKRHSTGLVKSTAHRRPLILIHLEVYATAGEAYNRELALKMPSAGKFKRELRNRLGL